MPQVLLPFERDTRTDKKAKAARERLLWQGMSPQLRKVVEHTPFLLTYLRMIALEKIGVPAYYPELSRKLGDLKQPNLIYPVDRNIYIHIYPNLEGGRDRYVAVEPILDQNLGPLLSDVENKLLDYSHRFAAVENDDARRQALLESVSELCSTGGARPQSGGLRKQKKSGNGKVHVTRDQLEAIKYLIVRDKIGLDVLEPMIRDSHIEDISCSGLGNIFVEHKVFKSLESVLHFAEYEELDDFALRLSERIKRPVSYHNPIVDATLPDGSRINIVYGRDVAKRGSNFSVRKFSETPLSVMELIEFGSLDYRMAAYLSMVIGEGMNVFVSGETASGKTTLLNALTTFIHPNAKIVSIEDTPELQVPHKNWLREVVQTTKETADSGVTMFDLLKAALRQRPNMILVGEIRGSEGAIAFQGMQTGHSVMATFHAASVEKLIQRLTGSPISVPRNYVDNLNVVVIQSAVTLPNGKKGRRALSVNEIVGYDPQSQSFSFMEVFRWDPATDVFEFTGHLSSYLLEDKIAVRKGIPTHQKKKIYGELDRRAKVFKTLHQERGVKGFYELLEVLAKAQREGLI